MFLRLVALSGDDTWTRRRVPASEITSLDVDVVALNEVLDRFGSHRLLSFDRDKTSGAPIIEVGHEALLTEWTRLAAWTKDARDDLKHHAAFSAARDEWETSDRDPGYLMTGSRLVEYERWASSGRMELNAPELDFLGVSLEARSVEVQAETERTQRETDLRSRSRRRLWGLVAALAVLGTAVTAYVVTTVLKDAVTIAVVYDDTGVLGRLLELGTDDAQRDFSFDLALKSPPFGNLDDVYERLAESRTDLVITVSGLGSSNLDEIASPVLGNDIRRAHGRVPVVERERGRL